jgi:hypothetical protein
LKNALFGECRSMRFSTIICLASLLLLASLARSDGQAKNQTGQRIVAEDLLKTKLEQLITIEFTFQPLRDALDRLRDRYDIPMQINEEAFRKNAGIQDVKNQPIRLRVANVKLKDTLQKLLDQVQGTYDIRNRQVLIFPK